MNPRNEAAIYVVKACVIAAVFYAGFSLLPVERWTSEFTADVLTFFGILAESYEQEGRIYLEYLQISMDCTALEVMAIFLGLTLAVNSPSRRRIYFSIFCTTAVFFSNIGRISIVYYLLERGIPWWLAHDLFSGGLSIGAGILFLTLTERYLPPVNTHLYTLLDAAESLLRTR